MPTAKSIFDKKPRLLDAFINVLIYVCASISIIILAGIVIYVTYRGAGAINWRFLTTVPSAIKGTFGIAGNIVNTLYMIIITLLIAVPFGVGATVYLNEYAKPGRLVRSLNLPPKHSQGFLPLFSDYLAMYSSVQP